MHPKENLEANVEIPGSEFLQRQSSAYTEFGQRQAFFNLAYVKSLRAEELKAYFQNNKLTKVWLGPRLFEFECELDRIETETLPGDFLLDGSEYSLTEKAKLIKGSFAIFNNNDVASPQAQSVYKELVKRCRDTCFAVWDWDNHHWLELSGFLAAHADVYCPAHHENLYQLSRYNWNIAGPIYCASIQWPDKFLSDWLAYILAAERSNDPLGKHIPHPAFIFRAQTIATVNQYFPTVTFSTPEFHNRTREDRMREWCSHKSHWISPVLNDIPIRLFDSLITGGIPIAPASLRFLEPVASIPRDQIVFYSAADILNPRPIATAAAAMFDAGGIRGLLARHNYALQKHHANRAIKQIVEVCQELLASPDQGGSH
jgi:hypothetical protein